MSWPTLQAALEEGIAINLPAALASIEYVGQFKRLLQLAEASQEFKHKVGGCVGLDWMEAIMENQRTHRS